jgi:hypothetical protein
MTSMTTRGPFFFKAFGKTTVVAAARYDFLRVGEEKPGEATVFFRLHLRGANRKKNCFCR